MFWTMWSDTEQLSDIEFTEQEARNILKEERHMLAKNAAGDEITEHDGPIHVARVKTNDTVED